MSDSPNILLFLTDDHAPWTLPCYGNNEVRSPAFDMMAENGTVFSNAFTPGPVCSPGRACLLTGRLPSQHGVHDWISMNDPECLDRDWLADEITLAQIFNKNGYLCGLSGKWHLGRDYETPRGYDWCFGYPDFEKPVHIGNCNYVFNNRPLKIEGNRTQITTDYALEFLEGRNDNQPFFLQVGYIATHSPFTGQEPELVESYKNASFKDIKTVTEHPWAWNEDFPEDHKVTPEEARLRHQNQYAAVSDIDRNIGRILEFLEKNGELDNTIIIYTSDHGLALGQKGFWGKANGTRPLNMYELSIRIPLMFYGANIARGVRVPECVDHLDTFQTICDLCGVKLEDANRPGNSFLPFLFGGKTNWNNIKFGEYGDMRIVRTPEFKLVKRYDSTMPDELFDLVNDPEEKINSIDFPEYATVRQKLEGEICRYFQKYSDPAKSGLNVRKLPRHNAPQKPSQKISSEAWRDGINELRKES